MKRLLILILLYSIGSIVNAQDPDPELFQTWYLYDVLNGDDESYEVYLIDPPISPSITISENLEFIGEGACNSFNGTFSLPFQGQLVANDFNNTTTDCGIPVHNGFEDSYFGFMAIKFGYSYNIIPDGDGLRLNLSEPLDGYAVFKNYQLSTPELNLDDVKIYPNPSSSRVFIESLTDPVTKVEIYNLLGSKVQTKSQDLESIDVSNLNSGIYLMKIYTEVGAVVKKIMKQ